MARYDRQLAVQFPGGDEADTVLTASAKDLLAKGGAKGLPGAFVAVPPRGASSDADAAAAAGPWRDRLCEELRRLTPQSRLYLGGRGDWRGQAVGGWDAASAADLLAGCGLPAVKTISILADEAGRDRGPRAGADLAEPPDGFASQFHRRLKEAHGIEVEVQARVYPVRVLAGESGEGRGRKETYDAARGEWANHRPRSKLRYSWVDGRQVRAWADYGPEARAARG